MRFTLALAPLALCASMAQAQNQGPYREAPDPDLDAVCLYWGQMGQLIMANRQAGTPMSMLMAMAIDRAHDVTTTFPTEVFRATVIEAYSRSRMATQFMQERAADDFRTELEHGCYVLKS